MPPSADDKLIEDAVQDFSRELRSDLPLRHFGEFHDSEKLKDVAEQQKQNVFKKLFDKIWTRDKEEIVSMFKKLYRRIDKEVIAEWVTKNQEHEIRSMSFLQERVDMLCGDFDAALEDQLLLNPDMELESFKNYIEGRKLFAASCFDRIWKPCNAQIQEEHKSKFEKHLKAKEEEVLEKQELHLHRKLVEKGESLLDEVTSIVLERSRQLKSYVSSHQGHVSTASLRGIVEEIREYLLNGKGSTLRGSHEEILSKLVAILDSKIKCLTEKTKEYMTSEDAVGYTERFDEKLRFCIMDTVADNVQEMPQDSSRRNSTTVTIRERQGCQVMMEILSEFKESQPDSLDLEENESKGFSFGNDTNAKGGKDRMSNYNEGPGPSTGGTKVCRRSSRRRRGSVKDTDFNDLTMATGADARVPEVSPSTKQKLKCVPRKKIARNRNCSIYSDLTRKCTGDKEESPHPNSKNYNIGQDDGPMNTPRSPTSSFKANMGGEGDEDCFEGSQQKPKKPKYDVSKTNRKVSGRNGVPMASSGQTQLNGSKLRHSHAKKRCRSDIKACPKNITILKGDCPKKYSCNVCKAKFTHMRYMKYHGEFCCTVKSKSFICDECGKGFHRKSHLNRHILMHTGEKRFECSQCQERFTRKETLQDHIRCHIKEKPFQCTKCPEWFAHRTNLSRHIRSHAKGNPYICQPCNLSFVSPQSLHDHDVISHEGKFPFACSHCEKRFNCMSILRRHVVIHTDERPFECTKCGIVFAHMKLLQSHLVHCHSHSRQVAQKVAYDAGVTYLLKETKNESFRDIPARKIIAAVVDHVIKKTNIQIFNAP